MLLSIVRCMINDSKMWPRWKGVVAGSYFGTVSCGTDSPESAFGNQYAHTSDYVYKPEMSCYPSLPFLSLEYSDIPDR